MPVSFGHSGVGLGSYYGNRLVSPYTGVVIIDANMGKVIGGLRDFTVNTTRRTEPIRFIDLFHGGRIFEQAPQPEEVSIRASSALFYFDAPSIPSASNSSSNVSQVLTNATPNFGIGLYNYTYNDEGYRSYYGTTVVDRLSNQDVVAPGMFLNMQFVPFNIVAFVFNPSRGKGIGYKFSDCYIVSYSATFRIETAFVAEDVEIRPTSWEHVSGDSILSLLGITSVSEFEKYLYIKKLQQ